MQNRKFVCDNTSADLTDVKNFSSCYYYHWCDTEGKIFIKLFILAVPTLAPPVPTGLLMSFFCCFFYLFFVYLCRRSSPIGPLKGTVQRCFECDRAHKLCMEKKLARMFS